METIHQRIKRLRLARNLSLEVFAQRVGVQWQSAQQWERDNGTAPTRKRQSKVAEVLGISVEELVAGNGKKEKIRELADHAEDELLKQLLNLYNNLEQKYRDRLLDSAQFYHSIQHPDISPSNPLAKAKIPSRHPRVREKIL